MRKAIRTCLAVVVALLVSGAATVSASAEEFVGKPVGNKFTGKALNTQVLTTKEGGAKVECTALKPEGTLKAEKAVEERINVNLEGCKVAGLGTATVSTLFLTLLTSSSTMGVPGKSILEVSITITVVFPRCKIVVAPGQTFAKAGEVAYSNKTASTIEVKLNVKGIGSEVTESESTSLCGTVGEKNTAGTLTGNSEIGVEGGTLQIK